MTKGWKPLVLPLN